MALFGSGQRRIRPKAGTYVSRTIPGKGTMRRTRGAAGSFGYSVPIILIGTSSPAKAGEDLPGSAKNPANCEEADCLDCDEPLLPEDSWERTLDEDDSEVEKIMDVRYGRKTRFERVQRQYVVQMERIWRPDIDRRGRLEVWGLAARVRSRSLKQESLRGDAITRRSDG